MGRRGSLWGPAVFAFQERMSLGLWKDRGERIRCVEQQPERDRKRVCGRGSGQVSQLPSESDPERGHSLLPDLPLLQ